MSESTGAVAVDALTDSERHWQHHDNSDRDIKTLARVKLLTYNQKHA